MPLFSLRPAATLWPPVLLGSQFVFNIGFYAVVPFLALFLRDDMLLSGGLIGLILGLRTFSQQGMFILGGTLADRYGAKAIPHTANSANHSARLRFPLAWLRVPARASRASIDGENRAPPTPVRQAPRIMGHSDAPHASRRKPATRTTQPARMIALAP